MSATLLALIGSLSRRKGLLFILGSLALLALLCLVNHHPLAIVQSQKGSTRSQLVHEFIASRPPRPSPWVPPKDKPRILILQHFVKTDASKHLIQTISAKQHQRYAEFWDYEYVSDSKEYLDSWHWYTRTRNKLYMLKSIVEEQLDRNKDAIANGTERGADWVFMTDADVLIKNPLIPLHTLLPPSDTSRTHNLTSTDSSRNGALFIGTEDHQGFNSGNILFRICPDLIIFLDRVLALADGMTRDWESSGAFRHWRYFLSSSSSTLSSSRAASTTPEPPPSDQRSLCLTFHRYASDYASRFYAYKPIWLNAYPLTVLPPDKIQLDIHFVSTQKQRRDLREYTDAWTEIYDQMMDLTKERLEAEVSRVRQVAASWWGSEGDEGARAGLPRCGMA